MSHKNFIYPVVIKETYLDSLGHMNNSKYFTLFEEARWDFLNKNNYGLDIIQKTGMGPVILEVTTRFLKELKLRDEIIIESKTISFDGKIGKLHQRMLRNDEECCTAEFTIGFFDLNKRKLISPTDDWLQAVGLK